MSVPKVVLEFKNYAENGTMPFERRSMLIGVCDHLARLAALVESMLKRIDWLNNREEELEGDLEHYRETVVLRNRAVVDTFAENKRLREALESILDDNSTCTWACIHRLKGIAREALKEKPFLSRRIVSKSCPRGGCLRRKVRIQKDLFSTQTTPACHTSATPWPSGWRSWRAWVRLKVRGSLS